MVRIPSTFIVSSLLCLVVVATCEDRTWDNIFDADSEVDLESWAPRNLTASVVSDSTIRLTWQPAVRQQGIRYYIERKTTYSDYTKIASTVDTTHIDTVLVINTSYWYQVRAATPENISAPSNAQEIIIEESLFPQISVSATSHDFGEVPFDNSLEWVLEISNTGDATLVIDSMSTTNKAFTIITPEFPQEIASGNSISSKIQFTPTAFTRYTESLEIYSNDPDEPKVMVSLQGTGIGQLIWEEDFESYSAGSFPSTWTPDANAHDSLNNYVDNTVAYEGSKSLKLFGSLGGCWSAAAYHPLNATPPYEVEFQVRSGDQSLTGCHPQRATSGIRKGTTWTNPGRQFIAFDEDGSILSGSGNVLGSYNTLTWTTVRVRYERPSSSEIKISYFIDWIYKGSETVSSYQEENNFTNLNIAVQEGTAWFDAIRVFQLPSQ